MDSGKQVVIAKLDKLLNIAREAALIGADALRQGGNFIKRAEFDKSHNVKLKADKIAETNVVSFLSSKTDINIISEEMWETYPSEINVNRSDLLWVVDPLDGSYNFLYDIPFYCISIALWEGKKKPLLGVVYDFNKEELFCGIVGRGAWLNNVQINITGIKDINKAILCTGFSIKMNFSDKNLIKFIGKIQNWGKIRLLGSAGLSLAYVASGRADAYYEEDIMFWDLAAGIALVAASDGVI